MNKPSVTSCEATVNMQVKHSYLQLPQLILSLRACTRARGS